MPSPTWHCWRGGSGFLAREALHPSRMESVWGDCCSCQRLRCSAVRPVDGVWHAQSLVSSVAKEQTKMTGLLESQPKYSSRNRVLFSTYSESV